MRDIKKKLLNWPAWVISSRKLKRLIQSGNQLQDIIEIPAKYVGHGYYDRIQAEQDMEEILELATLVQSTQPKVIVEIGTYKGGTLFIWTRTNPSAELIVSIDLPGGQYGGGYDQRREKLYRYFAFDRPGLKMEFIRGNSHEDGTLDMLGKLLNGRLIDFLYIDADHTYKGVETDFIKYSSYVRQGGIIGFHDIYNQKANHQVREFWRDVKSRFRHVEIVGSRSRTGNGVIFID